LSRQASFEELFRRASEAAFVIDPSADRFVAANAAGCELLGYALEELLETPVSLIHPGELVQLQEVVERALHDGRCCTITLTCRTRTGECLPTDMALYAVETGDGVNVLGLVHDRSQHRRRDRAAVPSIRAAVVADIPALRDVYRRASLSNAGDRVALLAHPDALEYDPHAVDQNLVRAAFVDGRLVGFATLVPQERVGELEDLFVDPCWMRRGIARTLVLDAIENAREQRLRRIEVTANPHALGFYEKVGFVHDGIAQTPFGPGHRMHLPACSELIEWYDGPRSALRHLFQLADDSAEQIGRYLELGRVLVAIAANRIVGVAQLVPRESGTVELKSLAVLPDFQRRGIGRALVDRASAICRSEGASALAVTTATADIDNIRFYQRCGFRAVSIEQDTFTEANGYPVGLDADGIPVRDSITFTLVL
jgi:PAS domain S-box-containing protein